MAARLNCTKCGRPKRNKQNIESHGATFVWAKTQIAWLKFYILFHSYWELVCIFHSPWAALCNGDNDFFFLFWQSFHIRKFELKYWNKFDGSIGFHSTGPSGRRHWHNFDSVTVRSASFRFSRLPWAREWMRISFSVFFSFTDSPRFWLLFVFPWL